MGVRFACSTWAFITFGYIDESIYDHASDLTFGLQTKIGLKPAVDDFLNENKNWKIKEIYTNNNGLTILERVC
jgi:hypothetical protein